MKVSRWTGRCRCGGGGGDGNGGQAVTLCVEGEDATMAIQALSRLLTGA